MRAKSRGNEQQKPEVKKGLPIHTSAGNVAMHMSSGQFFTSDEEEEFDSYDDEEEADPYASDFHYQANRYWMRQPSTTQSCGNCRLRFKQRKGLKD